MADIVPLGTWTPWGRVSAVGNGVIGERYYWMVDKHDSVAMMPAFVVESYVTTQRMKRTSIIGAVTPESADG